MLGNGLSCALMFFVQYDVRIQNSESTGVEGRGIGVLAGPGTPLSLTLRACYTPWRGPKTLKHLGYTVAEVWRKLVLGTPRTSTVQGRLSCKLSQHCHVLLMAAAEGGPTSKALHSRPLPQIV